MCICLLCLRIVRCVCVITSPLSPFARAREMDNHPQGEKEEMIEIYCGTLLCFGLALCVWGLGVSGSQVAGCGGAQTKGSALATRDV